MKPTIKILVVEDDVIIAEDIHQSIKYLGYDLIDILASGEETLELVKTNKPDFVLMDIVLKGSLNGIETAEKLYHDYGIPVIFLTAYTDPITMKRVEAAHPYGHISKPFYEQELRSVIEEAVKRRAEESKN